MQIRTHTDTLFPHSYTLKHTHTHRELKLIGTRTRTWRLNCLCYPFFNEVVESASRS